MRKQTLFVVAKIYVSTACGPMLWFAHLLAQYTRLVIMLILAKHTAKPNSSLKLNKKRVRLDVALS